MTMTLNGSGIIRMMITFSGKLSVDWGDGCIIETNQISGKYYTYEHYYPENESYNVKIDGDIAELCCNGRHNNYQNLITCIAVKINYLV